MDLFGALEEVSLDEVWLNGGEAPAPTERLGNEARGRLGTRGEDRHADHLSLRGRQTFTHSVGGEIRSRKGSTHDLMQHETLAVDLDREPFHAVMLHGLGHVDIDHVPVTRPVLECFGEGIVVEVAGRRAC